MKILLLSPWLPWPPFGGARIRILETLRYLSGRHRVTLLTTVRNAAEAKHVAALNGTCDRIITTVLSDQTQGVLRRLSLGLVCGRPLVQSFHYAPELAQQVHRLTSEDSYDIIHVEFPFLAPYLSAVSPQSRAKKVLSTHNIETIRLGRELQRPSSTARWLAIQWDRFVFKSWEKRALTQFDGITTVCDAERAWIKWHVPSATVEVVPNGVDSRHFYPLPAERENQPMLVFTGLMDYAPNIDAAIWFCKDIFPLLRRRIPELSFKIVGSRPHPTVVELRKIEGVEVTGEVADIRPYLAEALAVVVPLRSGGGTRLKILEAMAMARPVISTSLGAEGLDVTPELDILIANTPEQFVERILSILASPGGASRLGVAGRQLVVRKYAWPLCLSKLESLYGRLLQNESYRLAMPAKSAQALEA
jgi:sugar transferase (PEP-CTERM/EpsH1 system associated)